MGKTARDIDALLEDRRERFKETLRTKHPHKLIARHLQRELLVMGGLWKGNIPRLSKEIADDLRRKESKP